MAYRFNPLQLKHRAWLRCFIIGVLLSTCVALGFARSRAAGIEETRNCGAAGASERSQIQDIATAVRWRHPCAAVFSGDGSVLYVANQRTGSVSLVDVLAGKVINEFEVGCQLSGLAAIPNSDHLLAVDSSRNELIRFTCRHHSLQILSRLAVAPGARSVLVVSDGSRATVTGLWSHCVDVVRLSPLETRESSQSNSGIATNQTLRELQLVKRIPLPFPPGLQCRFQSDDQILVADAFGGRLALVDVRLGRVVAACRIEGHNIRGLYEDVQHKRLLLAYQILNSTIPVTKANIERGLLVKNVVSVINTDTFRLFDSEQLDTNRLNSNEQRTADDVIALPIQHLGEIGRGAADPMGVVPLDENYFAVCLSGVNELAVRSFQNSVPEAVRIAVGTHPIHVVRQPLTQSVAIINSLDDSISFVAVSMRQPKLRPDQRVISLGAHPEPTAQDRGEKLFFDGRLSRDGWLSCHSCHTDGHTNGLLADTLGDKSYGTPKRTLTLLGTAFTYRWAWNGEVANLHEQVVKSQRETLHGPEMPLDQALDLVTFLHTLPPPSASRPLAENSEDAESLARGRRLFERLQCQACHIPPLIYASHESYDVGLKDERGLAKFNPPSLRGVSQGDRFLHDNRARTLSEVFAKFAHPGDTILSDSELQDLIRFLASL